MNKNIEVITTVEIFSINDVTALNSHCEGGESNLFVSVAFTKEVVDVSVWFKTK